MTIGLGHYLFVAALLFTIGVFGIFVNRKNVIVILMSIELILLAVNINLVSFSVYLHQVVAAAAAVFSRGRARHDAATTVDKTANARNRLTECRPICPPCASGQSSQGRRTRISTHYQAFPNYFHVDRQRSTRWSRADRRLRSLEPRQSARN